MDKEQARYYFHQAATQQDPDGQYFLGDLCDIPISFSETGFVFDEAAYSWYLKAAQQGHAGAQYRLGLIYENGRGDIESNRSCALEWYIKAAEQEHEEAGLALAELLLGDAESAKRWSESMEQEEAEQQYAFGCLHAKGVGVEASFEEAAVWYSKAAEKQHIPAQYEYRTSKPQRAAAISPSPHLHEE